MSCGKLFCTCCQDLYGEGLRDGVVLGYRRGVRDGVAVGAAVGYVAGYRDGVQDGVVAGFVVGHKRGYAAGYVDAVDGTPPPLAYHEAVLSEGLRRELAAPRRRGLVTPRNGCPSCYFECTCWRSNP